MGWNHRILAHEYKGEVYLQIHEVYYDEEGKPDGYSENPIPVGSETVKGITWTLNKMLECRAKPMERETYKDGELDGLYNEWDENGNLVESAMYKDGVKQ